MIYIRNIIFTFLIGAMVLASFKMIYLKKYGIEIEGVVVRVNDSPRTEEVYYKFLLSGKLYNSSTAFSGCLKGEKVVVIYLASYPKVNTLKRKILKHW